MEISGPLQHGGIIARKNGIHCVSGLIGERRSSKMVILWIWWEQWPC